MTATNGLKLEIWFGPQGRLHKILRDFEYRAGQLRMARAVSRALQQGRHLAVEAGTGTGKTLAYLIPALVQKKPLIVATGTIALQEQLYHKDIPLLQRLGFSFRAALLKGRSHYLCLWKVQCLQQAPPLWLQGDPRWPRLLAWSRETGTGDRAEVREIPEDDPVWPLVTADAETCMGPRCRWYRDCFMYRARQTADQADLVVVNQHLLLSDAYVRVRRDARLLPEVPYLVIDEAHVLEETAMGTFTLRLGFIDVHRFLQHVQDALMAAEGIHDAVLRVWHARQAQIREALERVFHRDWPFDGDRLAWRYCQEEPAFLADLANLRAALEAFVPWLDRQPLPEEEREQFAEWGRQILAACDAFLATELENAVRFLETTGTGPDGSRRWAMVAAPLAVDRLLQELVWDAYEAVVLTSATLTVRGRFHFMMQRLGLPEDRLDTLRIRSPFDWSRQACLWVPEDLPLPGDPAYLDAVLPHMADVIGLVQGRTLVLCTSIQNMRAVAAYLRDRLPFTVLVQGEQSKRFLMQRFRADVTSVLVATASFWQGFDVPGEALSCVIIDKMPFDVPSDPVIEAQIERIREAGGNPFLDYQLPRALLLLRQGLGRLIRHRRDVGLLVLFDSRIWKRSYGRVVLQELRHIPVVRTFDQLRERWSRMRARMAAGEAPPTPMELRHE